MSRIFFFSSHTCVGESGGGHGVEFRLYAANKQYHLFDKAVVYVFGDRIIREGEDIGAIVEQRDQPKQSDLRVAIKKYIPSGLRILKLKKLFKRLGNYLEEIDQQFHFTKEDVFICHDFRMAYVFVNKYPQYPCALVYHMQGSIYFEWHAETAINSQIMHGYYNKLFQSICEHVRYLCFPSRGTEESLVRSEPAFKSMVERVEKRYLYNGVKCPEVDPNMLPEWIKQIKQMDGYKFITVANLNAAKAVQRIPEYLHHIKEKNVRFKWVLIGNGVYAQEVNQAIKKYGICEDVIWKQNNVKHSELMQLFSITDFYILFHKYSIFDLSTLEAMHYGNIPILTPVGGNKEMIIRQNGIFVSDFRDVAAFMDLIESGKVDELREFNKSIQNELFDDKAFLQRYADLCREF